MTYAMSVVHDECCCMTRTGALSHCVHGLLFLNQISAASLAILAKACLCHARKCYTASWVHGQSGARRSFVKLCATTNSAEKKSGKSLHYMRLVLCSPQHSFICINSITHRPHTCACNQALVRMLTGRGQNLALHHKHQ